MEWFKDKDNKFQNERAYQEWCAENEGYEDIGARAGHELQDLLSTVGQIAKAGETEWFFSDNPSHGSESVKNHHLSQFGYDPD